MKKATEAEQFDLCQSLTLGSLSQTTSRPSVRAGRLHTKSAGVEMQVKYVSALHSSWGFRNLLPKHAEMRGKTQLQLMSVQSV